MERKAHGMRRMIVVCAAGVAVAVSSAWGAEVPVAVSPGSGSEVALVEARCPTFSWGAVADAESYEVVVYRVGGEGEEARAVLEQEIAGAASSWTPSLGGCLERGGHYAWSVRAAGREGAGDWSEPIWFEVAIAGGQQSRKGSRQGGGADLCIDSGNRGDPEGGHHHQA